MQIQPAEHADLADIRSAYEHGRSKQRAQQSIVWPEFTDAWILAEIEAHHLFRVVLDEAIVGVFSVAYEDALIWGPYERGAHLYLHRIARSAHHAGGGLVDTILAWAEQQCALLNLDGLRMDTWASNAPLIAFYERRGFHLVANRKLEADARLATHYHGNVFALLERARVASSAARTAGT